MSQPPLTSHHRQLSSCSLQQNLCCSFHVKASSGCGPSRDKACLSYLQPKVRSLLFISFPFFFPVLLILWRFFRVFLFPPPPPFSFAQLGDMRTHVRAVHDGIKVKCHLCHKEFNRAPEMRRHVKAVHKTGIPLPDDPPQPLPSEPSAYVEETLSYEQQLLQQEQQHQQRPTSHTGSLLQEAVDLSGLSFPGLKLLPS